MPDGYTVCVLSAVITAPISLPNCCHMCKSKQKPKIPQILIEFISLCSRRPCHVAKAVSLADTVTQTDNLDGCMLTSAILIYKKTETKSVCTYRTYQKRSVYIPLPTTAPARNHNHEPWASYHVGPFSIVFVSVILREGVKKGARAAKKGKAQLAAAAGAESTAAAVSHQADSSASNDIKSHYVCVPTIIVDADCEEDLVECTTYVLKGAPDTLGPEISSSWWQDLLHLLLSAVSVNVTIEFLTFDLLNTLVGVPMLLLGAVILVPVWLCNSIKASMHRLCMGPKPLCSDTMHGGNEPACS